MRKVVQFSDVATRRVAPAAELRARSSRHGMALLAADHVGAAESAADDDRLESPTFQSFNAARASAVARGTWSGRNRSVGRLGSSSMCPAATETRGCGLIATPYELVSREASRQGAARRMSRSPWNFAVAVG